MKHHFAARKFSFIIIIAIAASTVAGAVFMLTPGLGVTTALVVARASFVEPTDVKFKVKWTMAERR